MTDLVPRGPGRPRDKAIRQRVVDAVIELIDAEGPLTLRAVVDRSGVSRAAIYRRWPSLTELVGEALDAGRRVAEVPVTMGAREALAAGYPSRAEGTEEKIGDYPQERLRQRLRLGLEDRNLQQHYWRAHVSRRRRPIEAALDRGRARNEVREDADLDAALDLLSGVFYYQVVARGASLDDPATLARCSAAIDIVWRGIAAGSSQEPRP